MRQRAESGSCKQAGQHRAEASSLLDSVCCAHASGGAYVRVQGGQGRHTQNCDRGAGCARDSVVVVVVALLGGLGGGGEGLSYFGFSYFGLSYFGFS